MKVTAMDEFDIWYVKLQQILLHKYQFDVEDAEGKFPIIDHFERGNSATKTAAILAKEYEL